jgi:hypothetical protein
MRAACSLSSTSCYFVLWFRNSVVSLLACPCGSPFYRCGASGRVTNS